MFQIKEDIETCDIGFQNRESSVYIWEERQELLWVLSALPPFADLERSKNNF